MTISDKTFADIRSLLITMRCINERGHTDFMGEITISPMLVSRLANESERLLEVLRWAEMKQGELSL